MIRVPRWVLDLATEASCCPRRSSAVVASLSASGRPPRVSARHLDEGHARIRRSVAANACAHAARANVNLRSRSTRLGARVSFSRLLRGGGGARALTFSPPSRSDPRGQRGSPRTRERVQQRDHDEQLLIVMVRIAGARKLDTRAARAVFAWLGHRPRSPRRRISTRRLASARALPTPKREGAAARAQAAEEAMVTHRVPPGGQSGHYDRRTPREPSRHHRRALRPRGPARIFTVDLRRSHAHEHTSGDQSAARLRRSRRRRRAVAPSARESRCTSANTSSSNTRLREHTIHQSSIVRVRLPLHRRYLPAGSRAFISTAVERRLIGSRVTGRARPRARIASGTKGRITLRARLRRLARRLRRGRSQAIGARAHHGVDRTIKRRSTRRAPPWPKGGRALARATRALRRAPTPKEATMHDEWAARARDKFHFVPPRRTYDDVMSASSP